MHLVFCRNVLIYFNRKLQNRVLGLFTQSLVHGGLLCLGTKEDIQFAQVSDAYDDLDCWARIFRRKADG
jgi:chemotaxis protein methyltransferase CheR